MPEHDPARGLARADFSRFLAACYYEPTPMFAEERMFDSMQAAAAQLDPALAERVGRLGAAFAAEDLQTLLVDYTRLFLGPVDPRARPYGSTWLTGESTLMQDATMDALELYREGGFEIDDTFRDLPDHVAVELEFLYVLAFRQHQAAQDGDAEARAAAEDLERRFLARHLGAWVAPFTSAVHAGAETAFYRALAELTLAWLRQLDRDGALH